MFRFFEYRVKLLLPTKFLWGSLLLLTVLMQVAAGFVVLRFGDDFRAAGLLHTLLPYVWIVAAVPHVVRALLANNSASKAVFTGVVSLILLSAALITGYASSGGEAGHWGSVILSTRPAEFFGAWVERVLHLINRLLLLDDVSDLGTSRAASRATVSGASTTGHLSNQRFYTRVHVYTAVAFLVSVLWHASTAHGASTGGQYQTQSWPRCGLSGATEGRDLRWFVVACALLCILGGVSVHVLRVGNNTQLSDWTKTPVRVLTELYLSVPYWLLKTYYFRAMLWVVFGFFCCLLFSYVITLFGRHVLLGWAVLLPVLVVVAVSLAGIPLNLELSGDKAQVITDIVGRFWRESLVWEWIALHCNRGVARGAVTTRMYYVPFGVRELERCNRLLVIARARLLDTDCNTGLREAWIETVCGPFRAKLVHDFWKNPDFVGGLVLTTQQALALFDTDGGQRLAQRLTARQLRARMTPVAGLTWENWMSCQQGNCTIPANLDSYWNDNTPSRPGSLLSRADIARAWKHVKNAESFYAGSAKSFVPAGVIAAVGKGSIDSSAVFGAAHTASFLCTYLSSLVEYFETYPPMTAAERDLYDRLIPVWKARCANAGGDALLPQQTISGLTELSVTPLARRDGGAATAATQWGAQYEWSGGNKIVSPTDKKYK